MNKRVRGRRGPGSHRSGFSKEDWIGIGIFILAFVILLTGGFWYYRASSALVEYDYTTYCPVAGPYATTAILIDLSDSVSALQQRKIVNYLKSLGDRRSDNTTRKNEQLQIYILSPSQSNTVAEPVVSVCNPGDGSGLSELTGNPVLAQRRFREHFLEPMEQAFVRVKEAKEANTSPLIDSIRGIALSAFSYPPVEGHEHRLVVISDMLENSARVSHYRGDQSMETTEIARYAADLEEVYATEIYVLDRSNVRSLQGSDLIDFWRAFFELSGTQLSKAERWTE